jgi:ribosomal protein L24
LFDWPYLRPGKVIAIAESAKNVIVLPDDDAGTVPEPHAIQEHLKITKGILHDKIQFLIGIRGLDHANLDRSDFTYSKTVVWNSLQQIVPAAGSRVMDLFLPRITIPPKLGDTVVFIRGSNMGASGTICELYSAEAFDVQVEKPNSPDRAIAATLRSEKVSWIPDSELCKRFRIGYKMLRAVMTAIQVKPNRHNIALMLYDRRKKNVVFGLTKLGEGKEVLFAPCVVGLLQSYFQNAGNLLELLRKQSDELRKKTKSTEKEGEKKAPNPVLSFGRGEIFPGSGEEQAEKLSALLNWLSKNAPGSAIPLVPKSNVVMSLDCIKALEECVSNWKVVLTSRRVKGVSTDIVVWRGKREDGEKRIIWPPLGQRVASVAATGSAIFGARGTVIGVDKEQELVTVLFDDVLPCGTKLEGVLKTNRGLSLLVRDLVFI